jgi:HEAT repeat protein
MRKMAGFKYALSWSLGLCLLLVMALAIHGAKTTTVAIPAKTQGERSLTSLQREIEKQRARLNAPEVEERRDAVARLGALRHQEASRIAVLALKDPSPIVRATATTAVLRLSPDESAAVLIPLLNDKDEFVRRETAYALGKTHSKMAVGPLVERLQRDKKPAVRGAAAVALGELRDEAAVIPLAQTLWPQTMTPEQGKNKRQDNPFLLRSAARSLGQIRSRAAVPALVAALTSEKLTVDVRREAAIALGMIGDDAAIQALRAVLTTEDPYLALAAHEALRKIEISKSNRP